LLFVLWTALGDERMGEEGREEGWEGVRRENEVSRNDDKEDRASRRRRNESLLCE
jgi:hypothetical protein